MIRYLSSLYEHFCVKIPARTEFMKWFLLRLWSDFYCMISLIHFIPYIHTNDYPNWHAYFKCFIQNDNQYSFQLFRLTVKKNTSAVIHLPTEKNLYQTSLNLILNVYLFGYKTEVSPCKTTLKYLYQTGFSTIIPKI